jgi:hypothetical protein
LKQKSAAFFLTINAKNPKHNRKSPDLPRGEDYSGIRLCAVMIVWLEALTVRRKGPVTIYRFFPLFDIALSLSTICSLHQSTI